MSGSSKSSSGFDTGTGTIASASESCTMDEIPIFDEEEVKMEILEEGHAKREIEEVDPSICDDESPSPQEDQVEGCHESQSDSEYIPEDSTESSESPFDSDSDFDPENLVPPPITADPDYPPVTQTASTKKIPSHLESVLEDFQDQLIFSRSSKLLDEIVAKKDQDRAGKLLMEWQKGTPECHDKLERQLAHEFLSYAFVKSSVEVVKQVREMYGADSDGGSDIHMDEAIRFFASVMPTSDRGDNEMLNFFHKLKEHDSFKKYSGYIATLSEDQISSIVWDASVKAQRLIMKLSKLHESALTTLDSIIKVNREVVENVENECQILEQNVKAEADKVAQIAGKSELTTVGRRHLYRAFLAPYFKTESGFAAPPWKPLSTPFKIEDLRQARMTPTELEMLQASILETVRETKKAYIEDRYCQILLKNNHLSQSDPPLTTVEFKVCSLRPESSTTTTTTTATTSTSTSQLDIKVSIVCDVETLLRWKIESIQKAERTSMEEIVNDPGIFIDWLNVSAKINSHVAKSFCPDELQRVWEKLLLPGLLTSKKMTMTQIQQLMECVKLYGKRRWDKVAESMGRGFTPFQCFTAYESFKLGELSAQERSSTRQKDLQEGSYCFHRIVKLGTEFRPHISTEKLTNLSCQVTGILAEAPNVPQQTLAEHYNRFTNPAAVKGNFRLVEDVLLLVCMVKMREYLKIARSFAPLKDYLPWRFISAWTARADTLFSYKRTIWSREEDLKLLKFAKAGKKFDWRLFSSQLGPDKHRKNTRSRYVYLQERLQQESFEKIREEYDSKERNRKLFLDYGKFVAPLETTLNLPQIQPPSFDVLRSNPSESTLWNYLASFDKELIGETISDLKQIMKYSQEAQKAEATKKGVNIEGVNDPGDMMISKTAKKPLDRRRFIRGDADSTASSIHLRRLALKPEEDIIGSLSQFQKEIYHYYNISYKGRGVKSTTRHDYIPKVQIFMKMAELQKIVDWPEGTVIENVETDGVALDANGCPIVADLPKPPRRKKRRGVISDKKGRKKKVIQPEENEPSDGEEIEEKQEQKPEKTIYFPEPNPSDEINLESDLKPGLRRSRRSKKKKETISQGEVKAPQLPKSNEVIIKMEDSSMFDFEESQIT